MNVLLHQNGRDYSIGREKSNATGRPDLMEFSGLEIDLSLERMYNPHVMVGIPVEHPGWALIRYSWLANSIELACVRPTFSPRHPDGCVEGGLLWH